MDMKGMLVLQNFLMVLSQVKNLLNAVLTFSPEYVIDLLLL